jgi:hypothetical protein
VKVSYDEATNHVHVTLSKRNVLALLHKVDQDWSGKTLFREGDPHNLAGEPHVVVQVEPDEVHYGERAYGPGIAHPETEAFIANPPSIDVYG